MNNKCNAVANSPNDDTYGVIVGRRKEGVAILWKTKFDSYTTPHKYDYDWVVSIEIAHDQNIMYICNVCLPCDNRNEMEYLDRLAKLHYLIAEWGSSCWPLIWFCFRHRWMCCRDMWRQRIMCQHRTRLSVYMPERLLWQRSHVFRYDIHTACCVSAIIHVDIVAHTSKICKLYVTVAAESTTLQQIAECKCWYPKNEFDM